MSVNVEPPAPIAAGESTPGELRGELATILASGLRRLRDRYALEACPVPEHPTPDIILNTESEDAK